MALLGIRAENIRNLEVVNLTLSEGFNLIVGDNASGKTSLLEAIFLLSRGRSFRTHTIKNIITKSKPALVVSGKSKNDALISQIGLKKSSSQTLIRINGKDEKKTSELLNHLQVQLIRPETQMLLERGPSLRKTFLDWGVFHVKPSFLKISKKHNQALKQRNASLKKRQVTGLDSWNHKVAEYGTMITKERLAYIDLLKVEFNRIAKELVGLENITLTLKQGWDNNISLLESLQKQQEMDLIKGYSQTGCHRADVAIHVDGVLAKDFLSRGQTKLLVLSLCLAQVAISSYHSDVKPCVLIDDLSAELDKKKLLNVMGFLEKLNVQIILTTTNLDGFSEFVNKNNSKVFHVEHGVYQELIK